MNRASQKIEGMVGGYMPFVLPSLACAGNIS
jgi:hypothetical protein